MKQKTDQGICERDEHIGCKSSVVRSGTPWAGAERCMKSSILPQYLIELVEKAWFYEIPTHVIRCRLLWEILFKPGRNIRGLTLCYLVVIPKIYVSRPLYLRKLTTALTLYLSSFHKDHHKKPCAPPPQFHFCSPHYSGNLISELSMRDA